MDGDKSSRNESRVKIMKEEEKNVTKNRDN